MLVFINLNEVREIEDTGESLLVTYKDRTVIEYFDDEAQFIRGVIAKYYNNMVVFRN